MRCSVVCPSYFRTKLIENMQGADGRHGGRPGDRRPGRRRSARSRGDRRRRARGLDRGDELILPDDAARAAYELKLTDRAAYDQVMRKQAARLNAMGR